jgi:hypothetical protein
MGEGLQISDRAALVYDLSAVIHVSAVQMNDNHNLIPAWCVIKLRVSMLVLISSQHPVPNIINRMSPTY